MKGSVTREEEKQKLRRGGRIVCALDARDAYSLYIYLSLTRPCAGFHTKSMVRTPYVVALGSS